jgi:hypothetical protein
LKQDEIYMIRKYPKKIKYDEVHGTYRASYGEAIGPGCEGALIEDDEE